MKKWQKITGISIIAAIVLAVSGFLFYRFYMVPHYLDPLAEKFSTYIKNDRVLASLYSDASKLHDDGVISDDVYTKFVTAYNKHTRNDMEYAHDILDENQSANVSDSSGTSSSLSARYASNKVGIEIIQTNDDENTGKSASTYSGSRTSDRTQVEDRLEAEKILDTAEATEEPVTDEESAYKKLKENMTSSEYSTLVSLMGKLDINTLKGFFDTGDKEGLKEYLHSKLSDDEYKTLVNLGYKYAYLFIE